MIHSLRTRLHKFLDTWRAKGLLAGLKFIAYGAEETVPVTISLHELKATPRLAEEYVLVDMTRDNYRQLQAKHVSRSRVGRMEDYFRRGYRSFCVVKGCRIIGDLWYATRSSAKSQIVHPNLKWFNIQLGPEEVYMFDMYVSPDFRGGGITTGFMNSVLHKLREEGYARAYGYYDANNRSALWVHRLIGWEEISRYRVRRFLLHKIVRPVNQPPGKSVLAVDRNSAWVNLAKNQAGQNQQ